MLAAYIWSVLLSAVWLLAVYMEWSNPDTGIILSGVFAASAMLAGGMLRR